MMAGEEGQNSWAEPAAGNLYVYRDQEAESKKCLC